MPQVGAGLCTPALLLSAEWAGWVGAGCGWFGLVGAGWLVGLGGCCMDLWVLVGSARGISQLVGCLLVCWVLGLLGAGGLVGAGLVTHLLLPLSLSATAWVRALGAARPPLPLPCAHPHSHAHSCCWHAFTQHLKQAHSPSLCSAESGAGVVDFVVADAKVQAATHPSKEQVSTYRTVLHLQCVLPPPQNCTAFTACPHCERLGACVEQFLLPRHPLIAPAWLSFSFPSCHFTTPPLFLTLFICSASPLCTPPHPCLRWSRCCHQWASPRSCRPRLWARCQAGGR
jgi:hypothetical protein